MQLSLSLIRNKLDIELKEIMALSSIFNLKVPKVTDPDQPIEKWIGLFFAIYALLRKMRIEEQTVYNILAQIKNDIEDYTFEYDNGLLLLDNEYAALMTWQNVYNYKESTWSNFKPADAVTANLISFLPLLKRVLELN